MVGQGTIDVLSSSLRAKAATATSAIIYDAYLFAANCVEAGKSIPQDVREVIDRAESFTQDRYGK